MLSIILKSFVLGFIAACSVGPMFVLVVYRASCDGKLSGIATALGIAGADSIFFSLGLASSMSLAQYCICILQTIEKIGAPILIFMGIYTLLKKTIYVKDEQEIKKAPSLFWLTSSSLLLTLSNPLSLIFFTSFSIKIFPELIDMPTHFSTVLIAALSLFIGSFGLFTLVSVAVERLGLKMSSKLMLISKWLSGTAFLATGLYLMLEKIKFG